jgi:hypothetical protein
MRRRAGVAAGLAGLAAGAAVLFGSSSGGSINVFVGSTPTPSAAFSCDLNAATAGALTTQYSAAAAGQTICLTAAVDYGTFAAGSKSAPGVTVTAASGIAATISFTFTAASNITIDGTLGGGTVSTATARGNDLGVSGGSSLVNVKIAHVVFRRELQVEPSTGSSVTLDGLTFGGATMSSSNSLEHMVGLYGDGAGSKLINSSFVGAVGSGGNSPDGIRADGSNWTIGLAGQGNTFTHFIDTGGNHTDVVQMCCGGAVSGNGNADGPTNNDITGNVFDQTVTGPANDGNKITAYIGIWDSAKDIDIQDNLFTGLGVDQTAGLLSVTNVTFIHNTVRRGTCGSFSIPCGSIDSGNKVGDNASSNVRIANNVYYGADQVDANIVSDHNLIGTAETGTGNVVGTPSFVGGTNPITRAGACLTAGSPGENIASDGLDAGIVTGC